MESRFTKYLHLILENTRGSVLCLDSSAKITFANTLFFQETGFENNGELIGKDFFELIGTNLVKPNQTKISEHPLYKGFKSNAIINGEKLYLPRKDGTGFYAEFKSYPVDFDSVSFKYIINFINITERENRDKEVARLSGLPEDNPNPIIEICTNSNTILYCNQAAVTEFAELVPKPGLGNAIVDWNHPLFSGLQSMVFELKVDGVGKALDVLDAEIGNSQSDNYRVYNRKLRYIPEDSIIRLYATDITQEQELLEGTKYLLDEVEKIKKKLENEHKEAEDIGKSLLYRVPENIRLNSSVSVEQSSEAGGDRAGFILEKTSGKKISKEWLAVFDASGHGKGAAKFQEVALGGMLALLLQGHSMRESLFTANQLLNNFNTGRFLVGNIWRVLLPEEREIEDGYTWIEEFSIGQHPIMLLEPGIGEVKELDFTAGENNYRTLPIGLFADGLDNIEPRYTSIKNGTRIVTYTDGITEAMDKDEKQFGKSRLKEIIMQTRNLSPTEAYYTIVHDVKCWVNNLPPTTADDDIGAVNMADDITVAIVDIL